jgi:hypothetical protein
MVSGGTCDKVSTATRSGSRLVAMIRSPRAPLAVNNGSIRGSI